MLWRIWRVLKTLLTARCEALLALSEKPHFTPGVFVSWRSRAFACKSLCKAPGICWLRSIHESEGRENRSRRCESYCFSHRPIKTASLVEPTQQSVGLSNKLAFATQERCASRCFRTTLQTLIEECFKSKSEMRAAVVRHRCTRKHNSAWRVLMTGEFLMINDLIAVVSPGQTPACSYCGINRSESATPQRPHPAQTRRLPLSSSGDQFIVPIRDQYRNLPSF